MADTDHWHPPRRHLAQRGLPLSRFTGLGGRRDLRFVQVGLRTPQDDAEHKYEALFHLDAANAVVDDQTKTARSDQADGSYVSIIPLADELLTVEIVKGREEDPVQGWAGQPWRAIPTAVYRRSGRGVVRLQFVLEPTAKGAQPAISRLEPNTAALTDLGARVRFADGRALEIAPPDKTGAIVFTWSTTRSGPGP